MLTVFSSRRNLAFKVAAFALLSLMTCASAFAQTDEDEFDLEIGLQSFDTVWKTIDERHWDDELVGESWDEARTKWRAEAEKAESTQDIRVAIEGLIGELGQSHFGVIPADTYEEMEGEDEDEGEEDDGDADPGLTFRACGGDILVTAVRAGSSADEQGIRPGWTLVSYKGKSAQEFINRMKEAASGPTRMETLVGLYLACSVRGPEGGTRDFVFETPEGDEKEMTLELSTPPGKPTTLGNLPTMYVTSEERTLDGGYGYYAFSMFLDPVRIMTEYRAFVAKEEHSNGIIIDLRGNLGGAAGMTMGMASVFTGEEQQLGTMTTRGADGSKTELKFVVFANPDPVTAPVAILVDEVSISSAEIFSGGMQDMGRAMVFGSRTAGLALPSVVVKLPNGDGFQYAIADYHSLSGKSLEMDGVIPDEVIELTVENLTGSEIGDPVLERAIQWIESVNNESQNNSDN
ncbi:MAG: S41 family peptidase [Planctomycetota bacterium]